MKKSGHGKLNELVQGHIASTLRKLELEPSSPALGTAINYHTLLFYFVNQNLWPHHVSVIWGTIPGSISLASWTPRLGQLYT